MHVLLKFSNKKARLSARAKLNELTRKRMQDAGRGSRYVPASVSAAKKVSPSSGELQHLRASCSRGGAYVSLRARFFVVPRCLFRRKRSPARSLGLFLARHNGAARTKAGVPKCTSSARAENECSGGPRKLPASRKTDLAQTAARVRPLPLDL
jgi:hypothetical protein